MRMTIGSREPRSVRTASATRRASGTGCGSESRTWRMRRLSEMTCKAPSKSGKSLRGIQKTERDRLRFDLDRYAERWVEAGEVVRIRVAERDQAIAARDRLRAKSLRCWKPW